MRYLVQFLLFVFVIQSAQSQEKEVLFTIDNTSYFSDEFIRVYNKNLDLVKDDSQKDLDKYLDLFIGYKLKVEKANKLGLQNNVRYQDELKSYRSQLAKNYLNDSKVTNELIEEAYDRITKEVKASHILILVDENASPEDTLKAYQKIINVKNKLNAGENFEQLASQFSEDPSVKDNKGNLGYFSAFRMVYPFENAAYTTLVGKSSKPFRTRFGYHIVKVSDIRKSRGEVSVAHIMIAKPVATDTVSAYKAKQTIEDIYKKIQQGENFESLASQFSDDKSTSGKGGALQRFGSNQLSSHEFEDIAFSLNDKNQISKPFQTQYGWHIVKLLEKFPVEAFQDMKADLESKVKKDERSLLITNSLAAKVREKYNFNTDKKLMLLVKKEVTNDFYTQSWKMNENNVSLKGNIVVINEDRKIDVSKFMSYVSSQQKSSIKVKPISNLIDVLYNNWMDQQLIQYYDDNLENEFSEFKNIVDEYRDGLLLFDLMEKEIWERAKTDTIGLQSFYKENSANYKWKARYDVDIYSSTDLKIINKAKSYLDKKKSLDYIKSKVNNNDAVNIMVKSGVFEEGTDVLSEYKDLTKGTNKIIQKGNYYFVIFVNEVKPSAEKTLHECKGKLISDYQQYLENNWVSDLKEEFKINVNQSVFEQVKNQILTK